MLFNLAFFVFQSITKEDHSLEKHGPGGAAHMQSSVLFPADGLTSLTDSGQLSQYRQRVVERMQEIKPNIAATSQLHSQVGEVCIEALPC